MSETVLVAETGRPTGSSASRRLRAEDRIPAVVYGHGMTPLSISVARRDLRQALSGSAGMNTVLDLTVDGKVYPAIVKDIQRHPVRRNVQHVDFQQVSLDEQITVSVPLRLEGEAREVLSNNGLVDPAVDSIDVTTTPRNIPDEIVIDITDMQLDSVIRLEDIKLPAGVTTSLDPETVLVTVLVTRGAEEEAEAAEGAEGEESGEGETAEGAEAGEAEAASGDEA
jgi:large subunit ribosomal protein L25